MKKTFIVLLSTVFIFSLFLISFNVIKLHKVEATVINGVVYADYNSGTGVYVCPVDSYIDDVDFRCLSDGAISRREAMNMMNVKKIVEYFDSVNTNIYLNLNYLPIYIKTTLADNFSGYHSKNYNISTTTVQAIDRSGRDLLFKNAYTPYISLIKAISIFGKYNNLGSSIQDLATLLNTTQLYIENSQIDISGFKSQIQESISTLQSYKDTVDSNVNNLYIAMLVFDNNNPDSFQSFIDSSASNNTAFNSVSNQYFLVRDDIVKLAVDAIRAVEAAYNLNSSISALPNEILNNGVSISKVTISVRDSLNNPIINRQVNLICNDKDVIISPTSKSTDSNGIAEFDVSSNMTGYISLTATVDGEAMTLMGTNIIESVSEIAVTPEQACKRDGGAWDGKTCICPDGFVWDELGLQCIKSGGSLTPEQACKRDNGTWDGKTCICPDKLTWDEKLLQCK